MIPTLISSRKRDFLARSYIGIHYERRENTPCVVLTMSASRKDESEERFSLRIPFADWKRLVFGGELYMTDYGDGIRKADFLDIYPGIVPGSHFSAWERYKPETNPMTRKLPPIDYGS